MASAQRISRYTARTLLFVLSLTVVAVLVFPDSLKGQKIPLAPSSYDDENIGIEELRTFIHLNDLAGGTGIVKRINKARGGLSNQEKYLYCRLLIRTNKRDEARKIAVSIPEKSREGFLRFAALAEIEVAKGSYDKASILYKKAGEAGFDGGFYLAALCELKMGRNERARILLTKLGPGSIYFGRSIERRAASLSAGGKTAEALRLITDNAAIDSGSYSVDRLNLLLLLGKIYINDERVDESLKTSIRIEQQIDGLSKETETLQPNYQDISRFPALSKVVEHYLGRNTYGQHRNRYWELSRYHYEWIRYISLMNNLSSHLRGAIIYKDSVFRELRVIDEKIGELGKIKGNYDEVKREISTVKERLQKIIDEYPLEKLYETGEGKKAHLIIQKRLDFIEEIEIMGAEIESMISRVKDNPHYEKMDAGKKTAQNKAIGEFFRLKKDINELKAKAGIIQIRIINLLKEPILAEYRKLRRKADSSLEGINNTSEKIDALRDRLLMIRNYNQRQLDMSDEIIVRVNGVSTFAEHIGNDLKKRYREFAGKPLEDISAYLKEKRALLHYLRGRTYLILWVKGDRLSEQVDRSPLDNAYEELKTALELGISDRYRPECYYAIAEILMAKEEESFARKMDLAIKKEEKGEDVTEPVISYSESLTYFEKVIAKYPESPYYENSLYSYAYAKNEMGMVEDGNKIYEELILKFPETRYADEINMRIGEFYFNKEDFKNAEISYKKVLGKRNRDIYITSKFKLGWALYNQERYEKAVSAFLLSLKNRDKGEKPKFARLTQESLNMIARCYIEMKKITQVGNPLEKAGLTHLIPAAYLEIEKLLFESSRFDDVLKISGILKKNYPLSLEILDSEDFAARSYLKLLKDDEAYDRYYRTVFVFGPESEWYRKNAGKKEWIDKAASVLENNLRISAYHYFRNGKEKGEKDLFKKAIGIFRNYLKIAPDSPYATDLRYDMAYSLYEVGSFKSASRIFESISVTKDGEKLGEPSLYMAVQSVKALYEPENRESVDEIIRIARLYNAKFPEGGRKIEITADLASAYFNGNMFQEAINTASELEKLTKDPQRVSFAKRLKGESFFNLGMYRKSEETFRNLLEILPATEKDGKQTVIKFIGFSIFKNAHNYNKQGKPDKATEEFIRLYEELPELDISPLAALEAGKTMIQLGEAEKAIHIFEKITGSYPRSTYDKEARRQIAHISEKRGKFEEAAKHYRFIGEDLEKKPEGAAYLKKAANLFFEMGSYEDAGSSYSNLLNNPSVSRGMKIEAAYFAGISFIKTGKETKGVKLLKKAVSLNKTAPEKDKNLYYASIAHMEIASIEFDKFRNIKIREPFEVTFKKKGEHLDKLIDSYLAIAKYGVPETLSASLYQIGECYEEFKNAILAAPIPSGLTKVEQEEYIFLLEEKAAPFEDEAAKSHANNVKKAAKFGYTNNWVMISWEKLKEIRGATYGRKPVVPRIVAPMAQPLDFEVLREVRK